MLAGAIALAGLVLMLNWNLPVSSPPADLLPPDTPVVRPLHEGIVELDWNDVAGADRYSIQVWRPTGWTDTGDPQLGINESQHGSRAILANMPNGTTFDTFRVRAGICGRWSEWSQAGRHLSSYGMDWQGYPKPTNEAAGVAAIDSRVIWSGHLSVGTTQRQPHDMGYSSDDSIGWLAPNEFTLEGVRYRVLRALQREEGFFVDLQGEAPSSFEFRLNVENAQGERIANLSSCDSIRVRGSSGERLLWLGADTSWKAGSLARLSISREQPISSTRADTLLWPTPRLSADFEHVPERHTGDEFSINVRFSEPVSFSADSIGVTSGAVTSVTPVDGQPSTWQVGITPDSRRSVRIRLLGATTCADPAAICTQQHVRLSDPIESTILGPPITARFLEAPEYHSGLEQVTFMVKFSKPLLTSTRDLGDRAFDTVGGQITTIRRVDSRRDLWEVTAVADSADPLQVNLDPSVVCRGSLSGCTDDLLRIAQPQALTIPPAKLHLTFDDGPHPLYTPQILDILAHYNAKATFFVIGQLAAYYPDLIKRIIDEGHTLANHTWNHDMLPTLTPEKMQETISRTRAVLGEHHKPCLRPPNYSIDRDSAQRLEAMGIRLVMGTVRSGDWSRPGVDVIVWRILQGAAPDAVVVLHDGGGDRSQTVEALRSALYELRNHNYSYEPVCE